MKSICSAEASKTDISLMSIIRPSLILKAISDSNPLLVRIESVFTIKSMTLSTIATLYHLAGNIEDINNIEVY